MCYSLSNKSQPVSAPLSSTLKLHILLQDTLTYSVFSRVGSYYRKYFIFQEEDDIQLLRIFTKKRSEMLKDFGEKLESSISKLKNDVAIIIKKKRERLAFSKTRPERI